MACGIFVALATVSCDNEYDLSKDINGEVSVGKNFTVPVGQTVEIPLSRIIKPGENLTVNESSGIYELTADGDFNSTISRIEPFKVNGLSPAFEDFSFDGLPTNVPDFLSQEIPVTVTTKATYDLFDTRTELPKEVECLYSAELNEGTGATSHIKIYIPDIDNGTNGITEVHLHNVKIQFPDFFTLQDGTHELFREDIILNKDNGFVEGIDIHIISMNLTKEEQDEYIKVEDGKKILQFGESISFEAETTVRIIPSEIKHSTFHILFGYSIDACEITRVNGRAVPDVSIDTNLALNNLPDFIKDEESKFVPNDIAFNLELTNPIGMALSTILTITPWNDAYNMPAGTPIEINIEGNNSIKPNATTKYVITNNPNRNVASDVILIECSELPSLLSPIPDSYKITSADIVADGEGSTGITLGSEYTLEGKYDVDVPFSFSSIDIHYSDFVDGLLDDLEDVADLTNKIILNCDAVSTIPVDLEASVKLYDIYGNELDEIVVTGNDGNKVFINASKNGEPTTTPITLTIEELEGSTQLEQLEKLEYIIKAKNAVGNDVVLKSSSAIIVKNGVAKLPNGVTTEL